MCDLLMLLIFVAWARRQMSPKKNKTKGISNNGVYYVSCAHEVEDRASCVSYVVFRLFVFLLICTLRSFWRTTAKTNEAFWLLDVRNDEMAFRAGAILKWTYFLHIKKNVTIDIIMGKILFKWNILWLSVIRDWMGYTAFDCEGRLAQNLSDYSRFFLF